MFCSLNMFVKHVYLKAQKACFRHVSIFNYFPFSKQNKKEMVMETFIFL